MEESVLLLQRRQRPCPWQGLKVKRGKRRRGFAGKPKLCAVDKLQAVLVDTSLPLSAVFLVKSFEKQAMLCCEEVSFSTDLK